MTAIRRVWISLCVTIVFILTQLIGGWIAHSLALMADAVHMATDAVAFCLTLFAMYMAKRPATPRLSYGYYRYEVLGALASTALLWAICFFLLYEAINRLIDTPEVNGGVVFIIACITLVFNLAQLVILRKPSKGSLNVKAAFMHVVSDLIGNVGVILSGGIVYLTGWSIVDPIITILFIALIIYSTYKLMRESVEVLLEASPRGIDPIEVREALLAHPGVDEVHDLHIWTVTTGKLALSVHIVSDQEVLEPIRSMIKDKFGIHHQTIQIERSASFRADFCYECEWLDAAKEDEEALAPSP